MKDKSVKDLALRLNEINKEKDELELKIHKLDREYNEIAKELWDRIPSLKTDPNLQLKKVRNNERDNNNF